MKTKNITQRNLDLNSTYTVIDKYYNPIADGGGCICANCNKLITNIAEVKNDTTKEVHTIGLDCMETVLLNNNLLKDFAISDIKEIRKKINQILRFSKKIKKIIADNPDADITGIAFETQKYPSDWFTFYILVGTQTTSRNNDCIKIKGMNFDFLIKNLKNILNLRILTIN